VDILFPDNKDKINAWIESHPMDCKLANSRTVTLDGQSVIVQAYRLPLHLILYNVHNGRIASTYPALVESNGGKELDASDELDAKKIQEHLLSLEPLVDNTRTLASLKKHGQTELGIITIDGVLLDGNRRMSCISKLSESDPDKFGHIEVARLDRIIDDRDRYLIELGISMGMDPKVDYGPIDQLIKLDQGIKMKISPKELASNMFGTSEEEVKEQLQKFEIMKNYLADYYGDNRDDDFTPLKGLDTTFEELRMLEKRKGYDDLETEEKQAIEDVTFRLIREGDFFHRRIRKISHAVTEGMSLDKLVTSADNLKPFDEIQNQTRLDTKENSKTGVDFADFEESVTNQDNQDQVIILINKILNSLEFLDTTDLRLKEEGPKEKIIRIKKKVEKLVSDVGV
jgi:hypothetical protein